MYNKLFTKILDSSIWLEPTCTRIVWLTLLAAMDEDGYSQFASVANLAYRARVTEEEASVAVASLEGPDINSSDQDNEGRRIERIPGGWMVLNSQKYRDLVTRTVIKEQTRMRVARFRKTKNLNQSNAPVTVCNDDVTPSDTATDSRKEAEKSIRLKANSAIISDEEFWQQLFEANPGVDFELEKSKMKTWLLARPRRKQTRKFITNWINGADRTVGMPSNSPRSWEKDIVNP